MSNSVEETMSKSAMKKAAKLAAKMAAKEDKRLEKGAEKVKEEDMDPTAYHDNRMKVLKEYATESGNPLYPNHFHPSKSLSKFIEIYDEEGKIKNGEHIGSDQGVVQHLTGRIETVRIQSKKLYFFHIWQDDLNIRIQVLANLMFYEDKEEFTRIMPILRRGDVIGIEGFPARSSRGELSIIPLYLTILSPCLYMLPPLQADLTNQETRYRNRHLDLLVNENARNIFKVRSKVISEIRKFLEEHDFMEVETPMMNLIPGGATAKPFVTHHNELGMDLYMRVAPELYLKKLVVGGFDRVFEIGKNFRNEGIDMTHNPEFTSCEFYQAYANYHDLMNITEKLLNRLAKLDIVDLSKTGLDFTPPFRRIEMIPALEEKLGLKFPRDLGSEEACAVLDKACMEYGVDCSVPRTNARLLDKLVGHFIEPECIQPTFIMDHPKIMSPLAKSHSDNPYLTERFELFVNGFEIANAYTELNDPKIQQDCFDTQAKAKEAGDDEAQFVDSSFVEALEYGLPPTAGWGMGIDRLVMLLTGQKTIREVLLFPTMKP